MKSSHSNDSDRKDLGVPNWVWEILIFVTIMPAIIYAATSGTIA